MKRLSLAVFALYMMIGGACIAPVAVAHAEGGTFVVSHGSMTPKAGGICASVALMSVADGTGDMQGGCSDGHCYKMRTPEPSGFTVHAPCAAEPAALPAVLTEPELSADSDASFDETVNASPGPPGLGMVVMRE